VASEELSSAVIISTGAALRSEFGCMWKFLIHVKSKTRTPFSATISGLFTLINSKLNFLLIANETRSKLGPRPELDGRRESDFWRGCCSASLELGHLVDIGYWACGAGLGSRLLSKAGLDRARELVIRRTRTASRPLTFKLFVRTEKMPPNQRSPTWLLLSRDVSEGQNTNKRRKIIKAIFHLN